MTDVDRVSPEEIREEEGILFVCAYEDEAKCEDIAIDGSIDLKELRARLPDVPKDERIVFY